MVNPLQFTNPQAYSGGVDFSPLANLMNVYKESQQRAMQEQALSQLGDDPIANAQALTRSGVLPLARLGIGMRDQEVARVREDIAQAQAQANFQQQQRLREEEAKRAGSQFEQTQALRQQEAERAGSYLTIAQQQAKRAEEKAAEDTPEGRKAKLAAAGLNPDDPNSQVYVATGKEPPDPLRQAAEKRAQLQFEQSQRYSTREGRLQAVRDGELDINDPTIRRWVALGGDIPDPAKERLGIGGLTYTKDASGNIRGYQLSASGVPVEPKFGPGESIVGPGEMVAQKEIGKATGKATGLAQVALPKLVDNALQQAKMIDEILVHPGRMWATGALSALPDFALMGTPGAGFRARFGQVKAESFLSIYDQMRGAGQITNVEGDKGTSAVNRMSAATNQKEFDDAAADLKSVLKIGIERAQHAAKGDFSTHPKELQELNKRLGVEAPTAPARPAAAAPTRTYKDIPFTFTP